LRSISLHWTAHDYEAVFPVYHFCLRGVSDVVVVQTHDLRANMRDLRRDPASPYAAHTLGRNSWSIGLAVCGMADARPSDFGRYPLAAAQIDALCVVARTLADARSPRSARTPRPRSKMGTSVPMTTTCVGISPASNRVPNRSRTARRRRPETGYARASQPCANAVPPKLAAALLRIALAAGVALIAIMTWHPWTCTWTGRCGS
jgi:hypothetical protein